MTTYSVYLIKRTSKKGTVSFYTGYSKQPPIRFQQHKDGKVKSTRGYALEGMAVFMTFETPGLAMKWERTAKKWSHKVKHLTYKAVKGSGRGFYS